MECSHIAMSTVLESMMLFLHEPIPVANICMVLPAFPRFVLPLFINDLIEEVKKFGSLYKYDNLLSDNSHSLYVVGLV